MKYRLVIILLVSLCCVGVANAQPANLERPTKLRVTGSLLPHEEQQRDDLVTVSILIEDKPLLLRVGKVEELSHTEREQAVKWGVLLRQVRFYGPETLIGRLQEPATLGKVLTIEGQLDTKARQFLVTAVQEGTGGNEQSPGEK
jgi:hypothetical protein